MAGKQPRFRRDENRAAFKFSEKDVPLEFSTMVQSARVKEPFFSYIVPRSGRLFGFTVKPETLPKKKNEVLLTIVSDEQGQKLERRRPLVLKGADMGEVMVSQGDKVHLSLENDAGTAEATNIWISFKIIGR